MVGEEAGDEVLPPWVHDSTSRACTTYHANFACVLLQAFTHKPEGRNRPETARRHPRFTRVRFPASCNYLLSSGLRKMCNDNGGIIIRNGEIRNPGRHPRFTNV